MSKNTLLRRVFDLSVILLALPLLGFAQVNEEAKARTLRLEPLELTLRVGCLLYTSDAADE